jgi:hypothetical protein
VDHRCFHPHSPAVARVLRTLARLEKDGVSVTFASDGRSPGVPVTQRRIRRAQTRSTPSHATTATTATVILKRCPDHDVWITQSTCALLIGMDPICRSLRNGAGCRGADHRRLRRKSVTVEYRPPLPSEQRTDVTPRRWSRGNA